MTEPAASRKKAAGRISKVLQGTVVSTKMDKTITVMVERRAMHPMYRKTVRVRRKFYAHDEARSAGVGDLVTIVSTRPLSKLKRWRLIEINRKAPVV